MALSFSEGNVEVLSDFVDELEGVEILVACRIVSVMNDDGKIFSHVAVLDGLNDHALESLAPILELSVVVELSAVKKATSPGVHGGN